jgi:hypothetical protein
MPTSLTRTAAGLVCLLGACLFAVRNDEQSSRVFVLLFLLLGLDAGAARRGHPWHSPPRFLGFALAFSGLMGYFAVSATRSQSGRSFAVTSAHLVLSREVRLGTLCFFLVVAAAAFTAAIVRGFGPQPGTGGRLANIPAWLLPSATVPLLLMVIGISPSYLWHSPGYLSAGGPTLALKLGSALSIPGVAGAAGAVILRGQRWSGTSVLLCYEIVAFAKGSRLLGIIPLLVLATWLLASNASLRRRIAIGAPTVVVALLALELPLTLRGIPNGGIASYASYLLGHPAAFTFDVRPQLYNLLFGFDLTGYVGRNSARLPLHALTVSVSPLPGGLSGWNNLSAQMRINPATPFNGLGELYNYGWIAAVTYIFLAATFLGEVRRELARRIVSGRLAGLFVTALTAILTVDLLQYNLRSTSRILYYSLVLAVFVVLVRKPLQKAEPTVPPQRLSLADGAVTRAPRRVRVSTADRRAAAHPLAKADTSPALDRTPALR